MDEVCSDDHGDAASRSVRALAAVACPLGDAPHLTAGVRSGDDGALAESSDQRHRRSIAGGRSQRGEEPKCPMQT
jgi:hypothetical protein